MYKQIPLCIDCIQAQTPVSVLDEWITRLCEVAGIFNLDTCW